MAQQNNQSSWESVWLPRITTLATTIMAGVFIFLLGLVKDFVKDFYSFKLEVSNHISVTNTWIGIFNEKQKNFEHLYSEIKDINSGTKEDHTTFQKSYYLKPDDKFRIIKEENRN